MKHLMILVIFLLVGCQTNNTIPKGVVLSTTTTPTIEDDTETKKSDPNDANLVQLGKPVICGDGSKIVPSLIKNTGEQPVMMWKSDKHGNRIIVMMNIKSKTVTVLEWPKPTDVDFVCILTTGINAVFEKSLFGGVLLPMVKKETKF
jgi:hypothetical protein